MEKMGVVLLAGGKSRRMGNDKARLQLEGESFLQRIAGELSCYEERLLSVDQPERYKELDWRHVADQIPGCGPIGGLSAALGSSCADVLLVVTCDVPLYRAEFGAWLFAQLEEPWDAVVPVSEDGIHPLCAVYRKRCFPFFQKQMESGNYRIRGVLDQLNVRYVEAGEWRDVLCNVNTPEEYQKLLQNREAR